MSKNSPQQNEYSKIDYRLVAIDKSSDGIAIINPQGRVIYLNLSLRGFYEIEDIPMDAIEGAHWHDIILQGQSEGIINAITDKLNENGELYGEITLVIDGQDKIAEISLTKLEDGGIIATLRDSAQTQDIEREREALKEQLHQAQKLEAIGRLAGGVAHDFNNILAAMNGYAEFLIDDLDAQSEQHGFAKNILSAGHQAKDLVDKMLAFSRREDGAVTVIDIRDPVDQTLAMLNASLPKSVSVESELTDQPCVVYANSTQIAQAVMNLCVNAKDAMPDERGRLKISIEHCDKSKIDAIEETQTRPDDEELPLVKIAQETNEHTRLTMGAFEKDKDYIALKIEDNGTGINRVVMEHIFEPFFTTKDVNKGTGLGLAMVHGVIAAHRGAMLIDSTLNKGTCFQLFFPLSNHDTQSDHANGDLDGLEITSIDAKILLVDDQDEVRTISQKMLERKEIEIEACESGAVALEILKENPDYFDIVITDQNMPEMTGVELAEQASALFPDLKFIVLSGYSEEKMQSIMKKYPCIKATLRKPMPQNELFRSICEVYTS